MFGSMFHTAWALADGAAKIAAATVATGAKVVGCVPVIAAGAQNAVSSAVNYAGQKIETGVMAVTTGTNVGISKFVSYMDVKEAQIAGGARVAVARLGGGQNAMAQAGIEAEKIKGVEARAGQYIANAEQSAASEMKALQTAHEFEKQKLQREHEARFAAAKLSQQEIELKGREAGEAIKRTTTAVGQKGQALADRADKVAKAVMDFARKRTPLLVPHICIPCLVGELKLVADGNWGTATVGALQYGLSSTGEYLAQNIASPAVKLAKWINPDLNKPEPGSHDGEKVGGDCLGKERSQTAGKIPKGCQEPPPPRVPKKKITYVNGIRTSVDPNVKGISNICALMQDVANTACAEVMGVYNATSGMLGDLSECVDNIRGGSKTPAAATLKPEILEKLRNDEPMELWVHSQGGLITQEALAAAKRELIATPLSDEEVNRRLARITIRSFGTAEKGWPKGPRYIHVRNTVDPVPHVIDGAQREVVGDYPASDYDQTPAQTYTKVEGLDPTKNHGMTESYLPHLRQLRKDHDRSVEDLVERFDSKTGCCKCA